MERVTDKEGCSDEPSVPYKKMRTEFSPKIKQEENKRLACFSESEDSEQILNSHTQTQIAEQNVDIGRHHLFNSLEQDDVHSSPGDSSSNVETENTNEDDSGNVSDSSSHASSGDWQSKPTGMFAWVQEQMMTGVDPHEVLQHLVPSITDHLPSDVSPLSLWKLVINILNEPDRRPKLTNINTLSDVVNLIKNAKNILVLTGAGVSVSCGIPDFRSRDGIYARLAVDFPDLPDPQAMFDISYFMKDPRPFFKFAKEIYPGQFKPSRSHRFISLMQKTGRLLRNYTQNIDTLEQVAGISRVIQCHGSFATASCLSCHHKVDCEAVREDIFNQKVPRCPICPPENELGIMKPDIVFFGESLPEHFHRQMSKDKHETDLLIVIGSSLKVRPVALIPSSLPNDVPQILINREPLPHVQFDVELLGDGDTIITEICRRLGDDFSVIAEEREKLTEIDRLPGDTSSSSSPQGTSSSQSQSTTCEDDSESDKNNNLSPDSGKHSETDENLSLPDNDMTKSENVVSSRNGTDMKCKSDKKSLESNVNDERNSLKSDNKNSASVEDSEQQSDSNKEKVKVHCMWKSRWKQSISKRLPAGTFHYDGKSRYIFPGAEVAPEEDDDSDDSSDDDYEDNPSNDRDDSSDESEDEVTGPGGLSSTRRDLRTTNSSVHSHHRHHFPNLASESCHSHSDILMHHMHTDNGDKHTLTEDEALLNISESRASASAVTSNTSSTVLKESKESRNHVAENEKTGSIIPDELHELITFGETSSLQGRNCDRLHSPLPENLHKILTNETLHNDKSDVILAKSDMDIPDTAEILELPSSSLLPPINEYEASPVQNKS